MIRKNTRFRLYLAFLSVVYVAGVFFLLNRQAAAYSRRMERLESDFSERLRRVEHSALSSESRASVASVPVDDVPLRDSLEEIPLYFVRGSGRSGRWGYIDILFPDGLRNRYYFRWASRRDLLRIPDRIRQDALLCKYGINDGGFVSPRSSDRYFSDSPF